MNKEYKIHLHNGEEELVPERVVIHEDNLSARNLFSDLSVAGYYFDVTKFFVPNDLSCAIFEHKEGQDPRMVSEGWTK